MTPIAWSQVEDELKARVRELTEVCTDPKASVEDIRQAQSGIVECDRLMSLPDRLRANAVQRSQKPRQGY